MSGKISNSGVTEVNASPRIVPMKVIVCSLMRTGTLSMRAALRELGIHDVYHMQTLGKNTSDIPLWTQAINAHLGHKPPLTRPAWDALLGAYQATVDVPASFFACELARTYPEARVVILTRDAEKWYESCMGSVYAALRSIGWLDKLLIVALDPPLRELGLFIQRIEQDCQKFSWSDRPAALAFFNGYYEKCRAEINPRRVLEFSVKDGWGPLCRHLNVPVPTEVVDGVEREKPFPRLNDSSSFRRMAQMNIAAMRKRVAWRLVGWVKNAALVTLVAYYFRQEMAGKIGGLLKAIKY